MSRDVASQQLLPPSTQSQAFSFVPTTSQREPVQRNYVFVDEHNRHKRLKVMRACEGCRRRKIKCDSATTNTWPCAACTRLKLHCVPPSVSYEKDSSTPGTHTFELTKSHSYPSSSPSPVADFPRHAHQRQFGTIDSTLQETMQPAYGDARPGQAAIFMEPSTGASLLQYEAVPATAISHDSSTSLIYSTTPSAPAPPMSEHGWATESNVSTLADAFGDLQIDLTATAPYIADQTALAASPAVQEEEVRLPSSVGPDRRIRIPQEMMPSDPLALQYFKYFFANIHPCVPVLSPPAFYQEWASNRDAISPLLLEAIFACVTAMLDKADEYAKWLALAASHEESFKDVSRLSTVQALILLMKARESQPSRRGYFYRSWMTLVHIIAMAKDLDLHEHLEDHRDGRSCISYLDCTSKTRMWQVLFVLEAMIGGPQGRLEFAVQPETVEFNEPKMPAVADAEYQVSRQFTYFARNVRNVRETIKAFTKVRRKGISWPIHEGYTSVDELYRRWPLECPQDLQIVVPNDESVPWIASPFIGSLNCYYYLAMIMHHRPQIHYMMEHVPGNSWKPYMLACLDAAKKLCRITEGLLQTYHIEGLKSVMRGLSFTIYAMLTCTMLHLAAITAPDPDVNNDARDYFVRSMRLLEHCTPLWPLHSINAQINALREAFSADINKPFDLRPGFPFGSPTPQPLENPLLSSSTYSPPHENPLGSRARVSYSLALPVTPPTSISDEDRKTDSPMSQSMGMMPDPSSTPQSTVQATTSQPQWNPSHLFSKWTTAFYPPAQHSNQPVTYSPTLSHVPSAGEYDLNASEYSQTSYSPHDYSPEPNQLPMTSQHGGPTSFPQSYPVEYVSPAAWQDAVASSLQTGGKRQWHDKNVS